MTSHIREQASGPTLIVCTVLTGILLMAILENICPMTWNAAIGQVCSRIALVGRFNLEPEIPELSMPSDIDLECDDNLEDLRPPEDEPKMPIIRNAIHFHAAAMPSNFDPSVSSQQYPATKKNWTMVRVTGYRKLLRMTLPVFDDSAEVPYHSMQRKMNLIVDGGGARLRSQERSSELPNGIVDCAKYFDPYDGSVPPRATPSTVSFPGIDLRRLDDSRLSFALR
ncbi:hypothetical protein QFC22_001070 [Naganishia vaughanmartiniae]|uniref:Uncharacterized protein n=1 Tax=Naganishia vaughanmartiniae TaxID=1424756 RepID=A0ACC2XJS9_9TREE|nr:hypothetical protein QFC22_001070 [Naganishia vaughanmartiniae]